METKILRKVQEDYGRWQETKSSHSEGHWQETGGEFTSFSLCYYYFFFGCVFTGQWVALPSAQMSTSFSCFSQCSSSRLFLEGE